MEFYRHDSIDIDLPGNNSSASLQKRAANRAAAYCRRSFQVPDYNSWSSTGPNNYSPFNNYYTDNGCADWQWLLRSGATQAALPAAPAGYRYPDNTFATEHIFEIQQVARFLDYAKTNVPEFQQMFPDDQSFCTNFFGPFMASTTVFADPGVYDYSVPQIQQVYNSLEGGEGGSANEFVYLEAKVNSHKGFYFRGGAPSVPGATTYQSRLAEATRTSVVAMYLNTAAVANIYREVSNRIVVAFTAFGVACNDTSARADYHQFGNVDWAGTYARWEQSYLNDIGSSMYVFARAQANFADDLIKDELRTQSRSRDNDRATKMRLNEIRARIDYQLTRGDLQPSRFTLPLLR
ncbi:hypothetical protein HII31_06196 [Pseudocercospora fuligena]|uniref:Uncharacterized protein n=1 Tax=Pseudocercospora fuligena TaxID=685502 RepID=A0A8H6RKE2_9PEZI|nr:hypothetical protein HII31_06196 [Pseudocercospora fuligena]